MDLKLNLAKDLPASEYVHEKVSEHDSLPDIYNKIFSSAKEAINTTMNSLEMNTLSRACNALAGSNRIDFYGVGGSGVVARDAYHKFFRLGIPCSVHDDPHMQVMSAALLTDKDVVIAISHTGSTKDIIDSIKIAKEKGATIIGILGKQKSPMAKYCDIAISVGSQEAALRYAPMTSRIVQLIVIDVLFVSVAMQRFNQTNQMLDDVKRALVDKRY
jgi:DNA-binding MurR/RpiR family transcriptional regulator